MKRAFSLTEVLVVILIVALIAAILLPVVLRAKSKSKEVPCTSNLKQLYTAWSLYMQDHDEAMPGYLGDLVPYLRGGLAVLKCPSDPTPGANSFRTEQLKTPVSYFYIDYLPDFRAAITRADPNHGIMYCVLHGDRLEADGPFSAERDTTGLVLRLRFDGSVQHAHVGHWCGPKSAMGRMMGRQKWSLLTDVPCKTDLECQGLTEPCGP